MNIEKNQYYKLSSVGVHAVSTAEQIVRQYPLTRIFLDILGRYLVDHLEFGIFSPGFTLIQQGDKGKDLYLICSHAIDVSVDGNMILRMEAPSLIGDKGIVDKNSIRNATISVSEGQDCLLIKIPMGLFIRSFKKKDIKDAEYNQEKQLYYHLFLEIQERLFKYADIQKSLWEEINTRIQTLNNQLIGGMIFRREDKGWDTSVWETVVEYMQSKYRHSWPVQTPITIQTVSMRLKEMLDKRFPRSMFKGSDQSYEIKKDAKWKSWLGDISDVIIKALPQDQLPVSIGDIELFNPRVYQMRINRLMRSIEKNLGSKGVTHKDKGANRGQLKVGLFFGKHPRIRGFDLEAYLNEIDDIYALKSPNRVLAQIAQQVAQLGALCENEFNGTVSKMRYFLKKIQKISTVNTEQIRPGSQFRSLNSWVTEIDKGFDAYHKRMMGQTEIVSGQISFSESTHPDIEEIIASCSTHHVKNQVQTAYQQIMGTLGLYIEGVSAQKARHLFHLCEIDSDSVIPAKQLAIHQWIPGSNYIALQKEKTLFRGIQPGQIIGGGAWIDQPEEDRTAGEEWQLTVSKGGSDNTRMKGLLIVIPKKKLPWQVNPSPNYDEYKNDCLPLMQWMTDRVLDQINIMEQLRDVLVDRYIKISEVVVTERKVRDFESGGGILTERQQDDIVELVIEELGIKLIKRKQQTTAQISKQMYNAILEQIKKDFPNIKVEEQGNKAYTLWRFTQSEILTRLFIRRRLDQIRREAPPSTMEVLMGQLEAMLSENAINTDNPGLQLASSDPKIDLEAVLLKDNSLVTGKRLSVGLEILDVLETLYRQLIDEIVEYQARLNKISSIQTEFDIEEIHTKFISESVTKFYQILEKRLA